ncbi:helix-turn-helix transcriptional regulator [Tumebacillus lacus]|uniref:helix-turn-helix transcriptional regulator n=1 Tax=Tumebacillus lacus TaxID=2995335 RepID=UPI00389A25D8
MIAAREKKGLSREQLAVMVGSTRSHIYKIEMGLRTPRLDLASKICEELDEDAGNFMRDCVRNGHKQCTA